MQTSTTRLTKPLHVWLVRILGLGIILVSIGINFSTLLYQGTTHVFWNTNENEEAVINYVAPEEAQMGIAVGDKVLNPDDDTTGEIGTYVTLKIQAKDGSVRDVKLARKSDGYTYGGILLGLSEESSINLVLIFMFIDVIIVSMASLLIYWFRSDDWMAILTAIMLGRIIWSTSVNPLILIFRGITSVAFFLWLILFPNGKLSPRWSWVFVVLSSLSVAYGSASYNLQVQQIAVVILVPAVIAILVTMIYRYRKIFSPVERQQSKWVVFPLIFVLIINLAASSYTLYLHSSNQFEKRLIVDFFSNPIIVISDAILILGILFAILRYRLWDIDFIINRSLVYGTLTALLAALFGGSLFIVSQLFQNFAGGPLVAVAVSATVFGGIFQPTRRQVQRFVDRRFYHIEIDYQKTPPALATGGMTEVLRQTHFGVYEDLELIGRGGMADVYKSLHPTLGVPVAIKILPARLAAENEFRQRFAREAQVVSKLKHPNIVRIFDSGEQDGKYYMVMEYLIGKDLDRLIKNNGKLPIAQALPLIQQIASALDYAHTNGFVHRDIKPSNVLLEPSSNNGMRAVLTDFGIAKINNAHTVVTVTGYMLGTFDYVAPEQIQESSNVDGKADIYALGVMTYQMLTGELPFKHSNPGALLIAHLYQPPPDACETLADLPKHIGSAIQRAMAKKPEERFATATEFALEMGRDET